MHMTFFAFVQVLVVLALTKNAITSCVVGSKPSLQPTDNSPVGILKFLRDGEEQLTKLEEDDRDMVAFIGIAGSGKTTLALHVGTENEDLTSVETKPLSMEYVINDKCNRSSTSDRSLEFVTVLPNRFIDSETKVTYFDMSSFSNSRSEIAYDVAATYFFKRIFDYARRIKLVLVVDYSHLKVSEDFRGFREMVDNVTRLVSNITKFEKSIALVVTKVVNRYDPNGPTDFPYTSDDAFLDSIGNVLEIARLEYDSHGQKKAVQLIDILTHKRNGKFDRMGLFRRPDEPGALGSVRSLKNSKKKLKTLINRNIIFIEKGALDFEYTLLDKSKDTLRKLKEKVLENVNMASMMRVLESQILTLYESRENSSTSLEEMISVFNALDVWEAEFRTIDDYVAYREICAWAIGKNVTEDVAKVLRDTENFINFYNHMNGIGNVDWSSDIQDCTREVNEYMRSSRSWYFSFLKQTSAVLSGYEVQRERFKYMESSKVAIDQIHQFIANNETINSTQLTAVVKFLRETGSESSFSMFVSSINVNKKKLILLEKLLNVTIHHRNTQMSCETNKLMINGVYILLSQLKGKLLDCAKLQSIEILALEKVFIDTNFSLAGTGIQLSIIAPIWVVTGKFKITLNGKDANQHYPQAPDGQKSDLDSVRNGHDGLPGLPGGPAGHFIGIAVKVVNNYQLTISAVGGAGGKGQNGGNGYRGNDGTVAEKYTGVDVYWALNVSWKDFIVIETPPFLYADLIEKRKSKDIFVDIYNIYGNPGSKGGNGGNGGPYGVGGRRGKIMLVDSFQRSSIKCIAKNGTNGMSGWGGNGGKGGKTGDTLVESCGYRKDPWGDKRNRIFYFEQYIDPPSQFTRYGYNGKAGTEFSNKVLQNADVPLVMPDFKRYGVFLSNNLDVCFHRNMLLKLRNLLDGIQYKKKVLKSL